jgi:hypothetical protein
MTDIKNDDESFELPEETARRAGRPLGAVGKKLSEAELEKLIKGNTKEAIFRIVGLMRSDDDQMSFRAAAKLLDLGLKMFAEDKQMKKLKREVTEGLEEQEKKLAEVKKFPKLTLT